MDVGELRALPPLAGVSDVGLTRIASRAAEFEAEAGRVLALPGDPGAGMFVLCEGTVDVELRSGMLRLGPGDFFGELALLVDDGARVARVRARHASAASRSARRLPGARRDGAELRPPHARELARRLAEARAAECSRAGAPGAPLQSGAVSGTKLITDNRRRGTTTTCSSEIEAGLLTGTEVKSLRDGGAQLGQAYAEIRDGEAWLVGASISEYARGNLANHRPERDRKLLLQRREIDSLYGKVREKGLTLVPDRLYFKDGG